MVVGKFEGFRSDRVLGPDYVQTTMPESQPRRYRGMAFGSTGFFRYDAGRF
jgi:hypothetical protein